MPNPAELPQLVFFVRGERVMLDADLAKLYGVSTKALNQALRRNRSISTGLRLPDDGPGNGNLEVTNCDLKIATV